MAIAAGRFAAMPDFPSYLCIAIFLLQCTKSVILRIKTTRRDALRRPCQWQVRNEREPVCPEAAARFRRETARPEPEGRFTPCLNVTTAHRRKPKAKAGRRCQRIRLRDAEIRNSQVRDAEVRMPTMEVPAAFREFAEKGVTQAKDNWEKMKGAAERRPTCSRTATPPPAKGCCRLRPQADRDRPRQHQRRFRLCGRAADREVAVRRWSEAFDRAICARSSRRMTAQTKELTALAQKVATETAEPIKESVTSASRRSPLKRHGIAAARQAPAILRSSPGAQPPGLFRVRKRSERRPNPSGSRMPLAKMAGGT